MAPRALAGPPHSLPPMLHKWCRRAMSGCSKGARGLFVLSRVLGILTETPISPSLWRRQRPSRYAIRAGRNLPDKEFRRNLPDKEFYLRTVIVPAAFTGASIRSGLAAWPLLLTFRHRAGVSAYTSSCPTSQTPVFLLNSRLGRFSAAGFPSDPRRAFKYHRLPFSRSYGDILPSSFSTVHSSTWGFSPRLRVSVCGTVTRWAPRRGFSRQPA